MRFPRITYSNVMATTAMFVALGGSSYAAVTISSNDVRNNSLRSEDIKNESIRGRDIDNGYIKGEDVKNGSLAAKELKNGSITADEIKDGSLAAADFDPAQLPAGPQGPPGPAGATNVVVRRFNQTVNAGAGTIASASCLPGETAVGGGSGMTGPDNGTALIFWDEPIEPDGSPPEDGETPTGWRAGGVNATGAQQSLQVHALCASP